jgi:hypothetical protein
MLEMLILASFWGFVGYKIIKEEKEEEKYWRNR